MSNLLEDIAEKLGSGPIDPRAWGSYATVGVLDDKGELDSDGDDPLKFIKNIDNEILVSVVLHPSGIQVDARLTASNAGENTVIQFPIRGGDEVYLNLPEGNPNALPMITGRLNNVSKASPLKELDKDASSAQISEGKFDNKTVVVFVGDYPVHIENEKGHKIRFNADGSLQFDGGKICINSNGEINIDAKGAVKVKASNAEVEADSISLKTATVNIGNKEVPAIELGAFFLELLKLPSTQSLQLNFLGLPTLPNTAFAWPSIPSLAKLELLGTTKVNLNASA